MVESFTDKKTGCLTIQIKGRFDYSCHKAFKQAFSKGSVVSSYDVDLSEATYLDSSALGMLLLLRDHAGAERSKIRLIHANNAVVEILKMANFHRLFVITE